MEALTKFILRILFFSSDNLVVVPRSSIYIVTSIMDQRLPVDAITTETTDWTCKVQVVDKFQPRKSSSSSVHFQTILVQDESEQQVSIILYGDDIPKYENLFGLFETYLVSCAKVREPRSYSVRAAIKQQRPGVEFDLLAVVVNCSAIQYTTDQSKHFREAIVIDHSSKTSNKISVDNLNKSSVCAGYYTETG
ncbi:hypothetical protein P3S68_033822 [Capsicum galapagoense]